MHILITRPEDVAIGLAKKLKASGHQVLIDPLLKITPTNPVLPSLTSFQGVITTSRQAICCLAHLTNKRRFPLWCVGKESARVATQLGFQNIHSAAGSAMHLLGVLEKTIPVNGPPLLHAAGDVVRVDLVHLLQEKGIAAERLVLYKTEEATRLSVESCQAILCGTLDVVLFYSPRTAGIFQGLCRAANLQDKCRELTAACLSPAIAKEIEGLPWRDIRIAEETTTDGLLAALNLT
jgi:uroporphyrinogen-III synthase